MNPDKWVVRLYRFESAVASSLARYATEREARTAAAGLLGRKNLRGTCTWYDSHHDRRVFALTASDRFATVGQERAQ
jgi:hypothetical protein